MKNQQDASTIIHQIDLLVSIVKAQPDHPALTPIITALEDLREIARIMSIPYPELRRSLDYQAAGLARHLSQTI